jgi:hypothetical protein
LARGFIFPKSIVIDILGVIRGLEEGSQNIELQREGGHTAESGSTHLKGQIFSIQLETSSGGLSYPDLLFWRFW